MLKQILDNAGLDSETFPSLLGINPSIFGEWISGRRPIPDSLVPRLSAVLGVQPPLLRTQGKVKGNQGDITPAIWFKLRGEHLVSADRECVLLIRQLGFFINQLEEVTKRRAIGWKPIFEHIREKTDKQASPREQGRQAAGMILESTGLGHGCKGIGEVFRSNLRRTGLLIIESPLPQSKVEGCSFYIGSPLSERPCLFANSYINTWFRRNSVLMHELAHAIFDAQTSGASVDFKDGNNDKPSDFVETRAQAFAQEALIPREVILHLAQAHGVKWRELKPKDLSILVAETHVEQKAILSAALEYEFISPEELDAYLAMNISSDLPKLSDRALTTEEYIEKIGQEAAAEWINKRTTTIPLRNLRLPISYVKAVVEAYKNEEISRGKAAEMLMIDKGTFSERFKGVAETVE